MRLSPSFAPFVTGVALAAALGVSGCNHSSPSDNNDAGDASDDDDDDAAVDSGGITIFLDSGTGEDSTLDDDALGDDSATGNCTLPNGTYGVTMTPSGDAGGAACVPTTSTLTFPLSNACDVTSAGQLPVCSIEFVCTQNGMGITTTTTGYIQVAGGGYAGNETVQVVSTAVGMPTLSTCSYVTAYTQ